MNEKQKKLLKTAGAIVTAASATYFLIGNAFYYVTLTRSGMKNPYVAKVASGTKKKDDERLRLDAIKEEGRRTEIRDYYAYCPNNYLRCILGSGHKSSWL